MVGGVGWVSYIIKATTPPIRDGHLCFGIKHLKVSR